MLANPQEVDEKENMCVGESVEVDERKVWVRGLNFNPKPKHLLSRFILGVSIEKV